MGIFGAGARRERRLQRLQDEANRHGQEALTLWRAGKAAAAIQPSLQAIDVIQKLRAEEPGAPEHLEQLASKLYNLAGILAQAGREAEAATRARESLAAYLELTGGDVSPQALLELRLRDLAHIVGPPLPRTDLIRLAGMTADAKSRLALLLAVSDPAGAGVEARTLSEAAVSTYQHLVAVDQQHRAGLERVTAADVKVQLALAAARQRRGPAGR